MTVIPQPPSSHVHGGFLAGEPAASADVFDEMLMGAGQPREHWLSLLQSVEQLGRREFSVRADNARRVLREHGASYLSAGDSKSAEHLWELDLLPFVISADEWAGIEAGIIQRAHLLNLVLRDLFGTQSLVRNGIVPAPLLYANPSYLRACQAVQVPEGNYLHTYAVDLGRAPDGQWWVLADRTQAPTGMGFALENRSVVTRVLPEAMNGVRPRSHDLVLQARDEALRRMAPRHCANPNVVLLSPGPRNEAYFEHTYLARVLGYTLVEGDDLTVRDRAVFVKTLDGLQRADVILRRVSDLYCDPLELRSDSLLGVPGLVEASRAGHVAVANALGSGLVEGPAFMPFLPGLSRHLLGEDLRLPSVATWWCGQALEFAHVTKHLDELSLRPSFTLLGEARYPAGLTDGQRAALRSEMLEHPQEFVGQESVRLSQVPVLVNQRWERRPLVLRVFASFNGRSYTVMPGGLARIVDEEAMGSPALSVCGGSKDVWVLGSGSAPGLPPAISALVSGGRPGSSLPSRAAENLFWLGRYTERLEHLARMARCLAMRLSMDFSGAVSTQTETLYHLLSQLGMAGLVPPQGNVHDLLQGRVIDLLRHYGLPNGVRDLLYRIHLAGFAVRDRLSADTWRILNRLESDADFRGGHPPMVHAASVLNTLVLDLAAFSGMEMENMTRGHGWTFLDLGRRLERSSGLVRLLSGALRCGPEVESVWEPVLEIADSVMTHRRRYFGEMQSQNVLQVLLADEDNPRSLSFQVGRLMHLANELPLEASPDGVTQLKSRTASLASAASLVLPDCTANPARALESLHKVFSGLGDISELVTQVYFSHIIPRVN